MRWPLGELPARAVHDGQKQGAPGLTDSLAAEWELLELERAEWELLDPSVDLCREVDRRRPGWPRRRKP